MCIVLYRLYDWTSSPFSRLNLNFKSNWVPIINFETHPYSNESFLHIFFSVINFRKFFRELPVRYVSSYCHRTLPLFVPSVPSSLRPIRPFSVFTPNVVFLVHVLQCHRWPKWSPVATGIVLVKGSLTLSLSDWHPISDWPFTPSPLTKKFRRTDLLPSPALVNIYHSSCPIST